MDRKAYLPIFSISDEVSYLMYAMLPQTGGSWAKSPTIIKEKPPNHCVLFFFTCFNLASMYPHYSCESIDISSTIKSFWPSNLALIVSIASSDSSSSVHFFPTGSYNSECRVNPLMFPAAFPVVAVTRI